MRHVLVNFSPGFNVVPSGMVTSDTKVALSQALAPPPAGVELANENVAAGEGGGKVGNGEGDGVLVGGVRANAVASWARRVWAAAVKMASTLRVEAVSTLSGAQAVRTIINTREDTKSLCPLLFICMRIDQSPY
jgi:hypothetical protein